MTEAAARTRILLADEQSLFREAMRIVLENEGDFEVVAEAREGMEAVAAAERTRPDLALIDVDLPNCDGIAASALIKERVPDCDLLVLSNVEDQDALVAALEAGASGYLTKEHPLAELIEAVRRLRSGETLVPPRMLGPLLAMLVRRRRQQTEALRRLTRLTRREREVLVHLADGATNQSIAQALVISPETARTHIQNVLDKLGVHSRVEAASFVIQNRVMDELLEAAQ